MRLFKNADGQIQGLDTEHLSLSICDDSPYMATLKIRGRLFSISANVSGGDVIMDITELEKDTSR